MLDHGGIALGDLIQLRHADIDLGQGGGLFGGPGGDAGHQRRDMADPVHQQVQRPSGTAHRIDAASDELGRRTDQQLDLFGRIGRPLRQGPHFRGDHGETAASLARARRLDPGIQRQQVGLKGDVVDHADDLRYLVRGSFDTSHRLDRVLDDLTAILGLAPGALHDGFHLTRARSGRFDRCGQLVQCGGGFLQRGSLVFGAARQILGPGVDVIDPGADRSRGLHDLVEGQAHPVNRNVEVGAQPLILAVEGGGDRLGQVARGKVSKADAQLGHDDLLLVMVHLQGGFHIDRLTQPAADHVKIFGNFADLVTQPRSAVGTCLFPVQIARCHLFNRKFDALQRLGDAAGDQQVRNDQYQASGQGRGDHDVDQEEVFFTRRPANGIANSLDFFPKGAHLAFEGAESVQKGGQLRFCSLAIGQRDGREFGGGIQVGVHQRADACHRSLDIVIQFQPIEVVDVLLEGGDVFLQGAADGKLGAARAIGSGYHCQQHIGAQGVMHHLGVLLIQHRRG